MGLIAGGTRLPSKGGTDNAYIYTTKGQEAERHTDTDTDIASVTMTLIDEETEEEEQLQGVPYLTDGSGVRGQSIHPSTRMMTTTTTATTYRQHPSPSFQEPPPPRHMPSFHSEHRYPRSLSYPHTTTPKSGQALGEAGRGERGKISNDINRVLILVLTLPSHDCEG